jgi:hypothetical protein
MVLTNQVHHTFHHDKATETPRSGTQFLQNPQQKRISSTLKKICSLQTTHLVFNWIVLHRSLHNHRIVPFHQHPFPAPPNKNLR